MKDWERHNTGETEAAIFPRGRQSRSPIHISVFSGHLKIADALIRFDAHNTHKNPAALHSCFSELLLFAVTSNSAEATTRLLDSIACLDCFDLLGQTPLYITARSGDEMLFKRLLRYNPDIDSPGATKNWTPLIIASLTGFTTMGPMFNTVITQAGQQSIAPAIGATSHSRRLSLKQQHGFCLTSKPRYSSDS